ncbi:MAG: hypothetical protein COA37_00835 [Hoeflea sp.]|uniref:peptidoglycan-binding domain-containing protein n=1 Tax=Hoeflea sp. TaxID=1940281 RepID=UPI000C0D0152|nr:peptidoglycan-binding domain-containing protein [Hoeflea sp.]PHR25418.1 MAG: hypothetical protein COA37_00835 [Hoeflea sp.]
MQVQFHFSKVVVFIAISIFLMIFAEAQAKNISSDQVEVLQSHLLEEGYLTGDIDGEIGPKTNAAIAAAVERGKLPPRFLEPSEYYEWVLNNGTSLSVLLASGRSFEMHGKIKDRGRSKKYDINISSRNSRISVNYPSFPCGGYWTLQSINGKTIKFGERITNSSKCIKSGNVVLRRTGDSYEFSWHSDKKNKLLATGKIAFVQVNDPKIGHSETAAKKSDQHDVKRTEKPSNTAKLSKGESKAKAENVAEAIAGVNVYEDIAGVWHGTFYCGRQTQDVEIQIFNRNGRYMGFMRSFNDLKLRFETLGPAQYEILVGQNKKGTQLTLYSGEGMPRIMVADFRGDCTKAIVIRHDVIPDLAAFRPYNTRSEMWPGQQKMFCKKVVEEWARVASDFYDASRTLRHQFDPYLANFNPDRSLSAAMFSDEAFSKYFGMNSKDMPVEAFDRLIGQLKGCLISTDEVYSKRIASERSVAAARRKLLNGEAVTGEDVILAPEFQAFVENRSAGRPTAASIIGDWRQALSATDPIAATGALIADKAAALSDVPPAELEVALSAMLREASGITSAGLGTASLPPVVAVADHKPGHILLSPQFGDYIYLPERWASPDKCSKDMRLHVDLRSLLSLSQLHRPAYAKGQFWPALDVLNDVCAGRHVSTVARFTVGADFYYGDELVAQALIGREEWEFWADEIKLFREPVPRAKDDPDYLYDMAYALRISDKDALSGIDVEKPEAGGMPLLRTLADRGDLQAQVHLAAGSIGLGLTRSPQIEDAALMKDAAAKGSAVASYLLAMELGNRTNFIPDRPIAPTDFASISAQDQADFKLWYAKAKLGGVFYSVFFDHAAEEWGIDATAAINFAQANELKGTSDQVREQGGGPVALSRERARVALLQHIQRDRCNKIGAYMNAPSDLALGNLFVNFEVSGRWCVISQNLAMGAYDLRLSIDRIEQFSCSGSESVQDCALDFYWEYRLDSSGTASDQSAIDLIVGGGVRAMTALPVRARGRFSLSDGVWSLVGDLDY